MTQTPKTTTASSAMLLLVSLGAIGRIFTIADWTLWCQGFGLIGFLALNFLAITKMAKALACLCFALLAFEWLRGDLNAGLAQTALGRAGFMVFFLTALGFLQHAAGRSPLLLRSGQILLQQPPGRRYLVLTFGSAMFGMLLNLSTIGLLGTMIRKAADGATDPETRRIAAIRKERMTLAMLRGFSTIPMWSPITVTIALISAAIPGVTWAQLASHSAPLALAFLLLGWGLDRRSYPRRAGGVPVDAPPLHRLMPLTLLVIAVPAIAYVISAVLGTSILVSLLLVLPLMSCGWVYLQERGRPGAAARTGHEIIGHVLPALPAMRTEATLFGASAFLGLMIADVVDTDLLGQAISGFGLSGGAVLALTAWMIAALSLVGINQIVTVTIAAGTLPHLTGLNLSPVIVGMMLVSVWTVAVNLTPYGTAIRLTGRMVDVPPEVLAHKWNTQFSLVALILLSAVLLVLA